jgi:hypothetical protein
MTEMSNNGTPMGVLTEEDWSTEYTFGKFGNAAEEKLYSWTLDSGQNDECGNSVDWHTWSARFNADKDIPALRAGVILQERSGGAVVAFRYDSAEELERDWEFRVQAWMEYVHGECADGIECDGCEHCENR